MDLCGAFWVIVGHYAFERLAELLFRNPDFHEHTSRVIGAMP